MAFDVRLRCLDGCSRSRLIKAKSLLDRVQAMRAGWRCGQCRSGR